MTILVAYTDGIDTWIGSDLLSVRGSQRVLTPGGKWCICEGWAIASAGEARYGQIQARNAEQIFIGTSDPLELMDRLETAYRDAGFTPKTNDEYNWPYFGSGGILARRGRLWDFDGCMTLTEWPPHRMVSDGMGWQFAQGAVWLWQQYHRRPEEADPESLLRAAIDAACALDPGSCEGLWQGKL